ncbi:GNAT family N-acetyltransferase [Photobacterium sagamiensis]|uniref:GNAT family N-acetyltransferase n=1 Tax=Photobacterium sagamiensis TaxID=2910241 RepID=UPI003D126FE0
MDDKPEKVRVERFNPESNYCWDNFDCGVEELNSFLHERMEKELKRRISIPHLCVIDKGADEPLKVIGYFTLSSNSFVKSHLSNRERRKCHYSSVPCILLSKIAVDKSAQGQGLGKFLLGKAIQAAYISSRDVAVYALFLQAREGRKQFYRDCGMIQSVCDEQYFIYPLDQYEAEIKAMMTKR